MRWNSRQRSTTSACVSRSSRSLPKSSIANDAITEPYTAAQRRHVLVERIVGVAVEVAEEAAGERVARARRIDDRFERHARDEEEPVVGEHAGAVAALLDDEHARPERSQLCGRPS